MLVTSVKSGGVPSPISPSPRSTLIVHQDVDRRLHHRQGVAEGDEPRMRTMGGYPYDLLETSIYLTIMGIATTCIL